VVENGVVWVVVAEKRKAEGGNEPRTDQQRHV